MASFDDLLAVFRQLLGPNGCPWDQKQTVQSIRGDILEEVHELLEAIDLDDNEKICEELGDCASVVAFFCLLAEKEQRFSTEEVFEEIRQKIIRRHPHVFADATIETEDELLAQWQAIKLQERGGVVAKSVLDGITSTLPALARSQEVAKRLRKHQIELPSATSEEAEHRLGAKLWAVVEEAEAQGIDAEVALRHFLAHREQQVRTSEQS